MEKPKKVLCKRTLTIGDPYYFDENTNEKIEYDNRMHVKGDWYDVVFNEHDEWSEKRKTFTIIDNQGHLHLHFMYTEEERIENKDYWSSFGTDNYGPRDYAKWFYTPEELEVKRVRFIKQNLVY